MNLRTKFKISDEILQKCIVFADNCIETNKNRYAHRKQSNVEKIKKDILVGKLGEEGVYYSLLDLYPDLTPPDHTIYSAGNKSWDTDLQDKTSGIKIGVKCQDSASANKYGSSWIFQYNSGKNYDCDKEVFKQISSNQYISFVSINLEEKIGLINGIVSVKFLHDHNLFKDPKVEWLKGQKLAVYYSDLEQYKEELWQL